MSIVMDVILSLGRRFNLFALTPGGPQICAPRAMPMTNYRASSLVGLPGRLEGVSPEGPPFLCNTRLGPEGESLS